MNNKEIGWAYFYNEALEFSDQFQIQMSKQLELKFRLMLGLTSKSKKNKFMLFVGMEEMKTVNQDGYSFALIEIICPNSFSKKITAYWKVKNDIDLLSVTQSNKLTDNEIEFGWCSDFDKDYFLKFYNSRKKLNKEENNISFDVEFDFKLFPDLSIKIYPIGKLQEEQIANIRKAFVQNLTCAYVSEITKSEDSHSLIIDFQDQAFDAGTDELLKAIQAISASENGEKIKKLIIE
jgi:hypothetical protein